jgi:hypothetical protein
MTETQWYAFRSFRAGFKTVCADWSRLADGLRPLQQQAAAHDTPPYPVETPVVYNTDLDRITASDDIRLIVIGDNPGKNEQLIRNRRYLVGQAGKIAEGFFRQNPELGIDFRKNVIILNKTPVHTAKTAHLHLLVRDGSPAVKELVRTSQLWMARKTAELHRALCGGENRTALWLVGYAELREKGLFRPYRDELLSAYTESDGNRNSLWQNVFVFQHFSMNRFRIDLNEYRTLHPGIPLAESLNLLGSFHRDELFAGSGPS